MKWPLTIFLIIVCLGTFFLSIAIAAFAEETGPDPYAYPQRRLPPPLPDEKEYDATDYSEPFPYQEDAQPFPEEKDLTSDQFQPSPTLCDLLRQYNDDLDVLSKQHPASTSPQAVQDRIKACAWIRAWADLTNRYAAKSEEWIWTAEAVCRQEGRSGIDFYPSEDSFLAFINNGCPSSPMEEEPPEIDYSKKLPPPSEPVEFPERPGYGEGELKQFPIPSEPEIAKPPSTVPDTIEPPPTSDTPPRNYPRFQYRSQFDPANSPYLAFRNHACGPTVLGEAMAALGVDVPTSKLIEECGVDQHNGANLGRLGRVANKYLPKSHQPWSPKYSFSPMEYLQDKVSKDSFAIVSIHDPSIGTDPVAGHYMLAHNISDGKVHCIDPAGGRDRTYNLTQFKTVWSAKNYGCLVIKK